MTQPATLTDTTELYARVQQFYADQMHLLDAGDTDRWADTFTEDGVFGGNGLPAPVRGRGPIATSAGHAARELADAGIARRHWLGMLSVRPAADGTVRARSYALVLEIPKGGEARVHRSTACDDVLVPDGESWLVRDRYVTADHLR
jgi:hypothetical protein